MNSGAFQLCMTMSVARYRPITLLLFRLAILPHSLLNLALVLPSEVERLAAIYSLDSAILLPNGPMRVNSTKSRFVISERRLNATIHSNSSTARFDEATGRVEMSATGLVSLELHLNSIQIRGVAQELELKCATERNASKDGETKVHAALSNAVNLSVVDTAAGTEIVIRNGRMAGVIAETWSKNISHGLSIVSSLVDSTGEAAGAMSRELSIAAFSPSYGMQIRVEQAALFLVYGQSKADISADHRAIRLWSGGRRIELYTISSPLEIVVDRFAGLTVNGYKEGATLNIPPNSSQINIEVQRPSRIEINRTADLRLLDGGESAQNASFTLSDGPLERVEFISLSVQLTIRGTKAPEHSSVVMSGTQSQLRLTTITNRTVSIVSARQLVEISGSEQSLKLRAGNVTLILSYGGDVEHGNSSGGDNDDTLDTGDISFAYRDEEQFQRIGPFAMGEPNASLLRQIGDIPSTHWAAFPDKMQKVPSTQNNSRAALEESLTTMTPQTTTITATTTQMEPIVFPTPRESIMTFVRPREETSSPRISPTTPPTPSASSQVETNASASVANVPTDSTVPTASTLAQLAITIEQSIDANTSTIHQPASTVASSTDDFVFGQYDTPVSLFPILATITNVELQTATHITASSSSVGENSTSHVNEDVTYASVSNETTGASTVNKRSSRELRSNWHDDNHASSNDAAQNDTLFGLDLLVDSRADVHSAEFKSSIEEALSVALSTLIPASRTTPLPRMKRSSGLANATMSALPIHVRIRQVENDEIEGDSTNLLAKITFTIDDTAGTHVPTSGELAEISPNRLTSHLPYTAISAITVKQRSPPIHSIVSSFAFSIPIGIIILGGSAIIVFSLVVAKMVIDDWLEQRRRNYLNRKASVGAGSLIPINHDRTIALATDNPPS